MSAKYNDLAKFCQQVDAALFGAALFFGCSNSSDTPFIPSSGGGSSGPALPASVGTNELAGKTFVNGSTIYEFGFDSYTIKTSNTVAAEDNVNSAYKQETTATYSYTYNSTTKQIFAKQGASTIYCTGRAFSTDAELVAACKRAAKLQYNLLADDSAELAAKAEPNVKMTRQMMYHSECCGYGDSAGDTAATNEQIAKYNKYAAEYTPLTQSLISVYDYNLSGSTFRIASSSRLPAGLGLHEIFGVYNVSLPSSTVGASLQKAVSMVPDFKNGSTGYKVSSITADKITITDNATKISDEWKFTAYPVALPTGYITTKNTASATFTADVVGTLTATYATSGNIPTLTGTAYTQQ